MDEDTDYIKLPLDERCVHKVSPLFYADYLRNRLVILEFCCSYGRLVFMVTKKRLNFFVKLMMKNLPNGTNI